MTKFKNKKKWLVVAGIAVVLLLGAAVLYANKPKNDPATAGVTPQTTPTPSPGTAGNPGDTAKSDLSTPTPSPSSKVTPTPTPTPQSGIGVSIDSVAPQTNGGLRVPNTVTGTSSGNCAFVLTDPSGKTSEFDSTVNFDGNSNFCTQPAFTNVTQSGSWSVKLTVTAGSSSGYDTYGFTI